MPISSSELRTFSVYKITSPSGGVYIGVSRNIRLRERNYRNYECVGQRILYNSLKKYGWENHSFEVIDTFTSNDDYALGKEMFWIRSFMSCRHLYPEQKGLNSTMGGSGNFGLKMSDETKKKISISNTGKKRSEEVRKKYSEVKKGIGRPHLEQTKIKIRLAKMGHVQSDETRRRISQTRKDRQIPSSTAGTKLSEERKRQIGLSKIGNKNCVGKKHTLAHRRKISEKRNVPILVFSIDGGFIAEFESMVLTSKILGVTEGTIWRSASGKTKSPKKYTFKYKQSCH